ncbi:uncharacterized protein LAESUDRAFT_494930 [Laetiporus sulphureus 93-53]|uniref:Uncharacterized protein n=1 Tax=Laetiporus sulphureus 93-53 TaxID=1314785 RepID=A0A165BHU9_9APHY|nr:uncharacterized protein LAESUDRAFT_494930 [Laetiporus sulphureus 93-53]KZT01087.1 hypothetical protein LAESUDRAFT_494930 [Laetiporus sulphureus 93-53]
MAWIYKEVAGRMLAISNTSVKHPRFKKGGKLLRASPIALHAAMVRSRKQRCTRSSNEIISIGRNPVVTDAHYTGQKCRSCHF